MKYSAQTLELLVDPFARPGFAIGRTQYLFRTKIIEVLRSTKSKLNPEEAWLMMVLDDAGGTAQTGALNQIMQRDPSTMTRHLDVLCKKKMVQRKKDTGDGRIINVSLTATGRRELARVMPGFKSLRNSAVAGINKENLRITIKSLLKIQENLQNLND